MAEENHGPSNLSLRESSAALAAFPFYSSRIIVAQKLSDMLPEGTPLAVRQFLIYFSSFYLLITP